MRALGLHGPRDLPPAEPRHPEVCQNEIHRSLAEDGEAGGTAISHLNRVSGIPEQVGKRLPDQEIIVDEQEPPRGYEGRHHILLYTRRLENWGHVLARGPLIFGNQGRVDRTPGLFALGSCQSSRGPGILRGAGRHFPHTLDPEAIRQHPEADTVNRREPATIGGRTESVAASLSLEAPPTSFTSSVRMAVPRPKPG